MEDGTSKMYNTFGKKEVDERVQELDQGSEGAPPRRCTFAEAAGAIRVGNFVRHGVNPLRYTQVRTIWGLEYEVKKGSPTPTGGKDLPLHQE